LFKAKNGAEVLVINAMGLIFMPELGDPFRAVEREVEACALKNGSDAILVDFHAEATSEKQAMGYFLDGRATCVVGTHTHAPTADERVLPGGTAFMSDAGMCGDYESVLGMDKDEPLNRFLTKIPRGRFEPAGGPATISGLAVDVDDATGLARRTTALRLGGVLTPTEPLFWVE
jgi:calcineurin-like phosphoesterase